eukprot:s94_g44.t2
MVGKQFQNVGEMIFHLHEHWFRHHSWKVQVSNPFLRQCCAQIHAGETTQDSMTWSECIKKSCPEINAANHVTI